jgi:hypothetical protein
MNWRQVIYMINVRLVVHSAMSQIILRKAAAIKYQEQENLPYVEYEVLTAVVIKSTTFWDKTP